MNMKVWSSVSGFLASVLLSGSAQAQEQLGDWRSCVVTVCSNGQCEGPSSNLIVVAPADFADPGFGGEALMIRQLEAFSERLYASSEGWSHKVECARKWSESEAMKEARAHIALAQMPPASHEIKIANPSDVWKHGSTESAGTNRGTENARVTTAPSSTGDKDEQPTGDPMNFIMWVDLREPINGVNALCFHAIKRRPAPEGYRGKWPTLKNALPIIRSYFPAMREQCSRHGTLVSDNVSFATDEISPAQKRASMQADVERWRKQGMPEVYISN